MGRRSRKLAVLCPNYYGSSDHTHSAGSAPAWGLSGFLRGCSFFMSRVLLSVRSSIRGNSSRSADKCAAELRKWIE
jgi:hypothetical protein